MARDKARPQKLVRAEDGTFGCIWGYIMDLQPIEMCLDPDFFSNCRGNLLAGDELRVVEMKGTGEKKTVTATCKLIVLRKDSKAVYVELHEGRPIYRYDSPKGTEEAPVAAEDDFHKREEYIKGDGQVEKPRDGDYEIRTDQGIVGSAPTLGEAKAKARGDIPL